MPSETDALAGPPAGRVSDGLVELLTMAQRRLSRGLAAVLTEDGATLDGYLLLRSLAGSAGRSMGELVAATQLPAPTLTRLVDAAVDAALAYRLPDPDDGRKVVVQLSGLGLTRLSRLEALVRAHQDALARALGSDRVALAIEGLAGLTVDD